MKKKDLELLLQKIKEPAEIKAELEQYATPASIAADILWRALHNNDIYGKKVADFGCGTGIFAVGAALLGADRVIAIDIDEKVVEIAEKEAKKFGVEVEFRVMDVGEFDEEVDTVIMNPHFGAQYANRMADRIFVQKAMDVSKAIYSLHLKEGANFIKNLLTKGGWKIMAEKEYRYPLKASLPFHKKKVVWQDVVMLCAKKL